MFETATIAMETSKLTSKFTILQGEAATGVPKRADRFVSQTAVFLAMCGIGLSMFCTRQLTEEPSTCSLMKRQKWNDFSISSDYVAAY